MASEPLSLLEVVRALDARLRDRLSRIRIATVREEDGLCAEAHLLIHLFLPAGQGRSSAGRYDVQVDLEGLPSGVSFSGIERYPDVVRRLPLTPSIEEQIRALHASGLVGGLDAVRMQRTGTAWIWQSGQKVPVPPDPRRGPFSWSITTARLIRSRAHGLDHEVQARSALWPDARGGERPVSAGEAPRVSWAALRPERAAALCALAESYCYTQRLEDAVEALDAPMALAYVDVAISALDKLQTLLEAQEKDDGLRLDP